MSVQLTLACQAYDRTRPLFDGRVEVSGVELTCLDLPVEETFYRMMKYQEFDIAELSLSSYVLSLSRGAPFVAVPVFPSRAFRHSGVYVPADSDCTVPADLVGKRIGVPEYQITAAVWMRGIFAEHHDLPVDAVEYVTGGLDEPGRVEKQPLSLPPGVKVSALPDTMTLSEELLAGRLDAVYSARNPHPFNTPGHGGVRRLFDDSVAVERHYAASTGLFPIMHTLVVRRDVYEAHPWVPQELVKAMTESKRIGLSGLAETAALPIALPWVWRDVQEAVQLLGQDWWAYGLEPNRAVLETFLRYSHDQGLAPRLYRPEELFAPESLTSVIV